MKHKGKIINNIKTWSVVDCSNCGFAHINPVPGLKELYQIYSSKYYEEEKPLYIKRDKEDGKWWKTIYRDRVDLLEKHAGTKSKKLLDIGSGPGNFLHYAKSRGWQVLGIEPSISNLKFYKRNGIKVLNGFYEDFEPNTLGHFDCVVMYEFLEHIQDPHGAIKFANKALKKNGVLNVTVPNDYNPLQKVVLKKLILKPYWLAPPFHINYFNIDTIKWLLEKNKFKVIDIETDFPMEFFLLMGENYVGNDELGRLMHKKRKLLDMALSEHNNDLKKNIYSTFAKYNIGRNVTVTAKKVLNDKS